MFREFIQAFFQAGIPIAATSYLLVWWALKQDYFGRVGSVGEAESELKKLGKSEKKAKKQARAEAVGSPSDTDAGAARRINPVHNKWLSFGGGFYGVVALLTYVVVELGDLRDFVARYDGIAGLVSRFSFSMVIELLVDAMTNFIVAISWPVYWLGDITGEHIWLWFVVAYGSYWLGARAALHRHGGSSGDVPGGG